MSQMTLLRIAILAVGIIFIGVVYWTGLPQKSPLRRQRKTAQDGTERREPILTPLQPGAIARDCAEFPGFSESSGEIAAVGDEQTGLEQRIGQRPSPDFDKIVTLFVAAREGEFLRGDNIVVAAEKTGLVYGHLQVFHRLLDNDPERGPIFSMANLLEPGTFEMKTIHQLQTPALAFFLTLPAPVSALDAWETMLPTVQRMAELLGGVVLDDQRNTLGRQRIAHIRDDLRGYDRQRATDKTAQVQ